MSEPVNAPEVWFTISDPEEFDAGCEGPFPSREAAIEGGRREYGTSGFSIGTGVPIDYSDYLPTGDQVVSDLSENVSGEIWVPDGGLAEYWGVGEAHFQDLEARMATAFREWAKHHSLTICYSVTPTEDIPGLTEEAES